VQYANSIKNASEKRCKTFSSSYKEASDILKNDIVVTKDFTNSMRTAMESANALSEQIYQIGRGAFSISKETRFSAVDGKAYNEQLHQISTSCLP